MGAGHSVSCYDSTDNTTGYGKYNATYLATLDVSSYSFCSINAAYSVISSSSFEGNSALLGGGAVTVLQGYSVTLDRVGFSNNTTPLYGGGVAVANGSTVISNSCSYTACTALRGGAIYAEASTEKYIAAAVIPLWHNAYIYAPDWYKLGRQMGSVLNLANSSFLSNVAGDAGGAVYMTGDNQLVSQGNTFEASQAATQGGFATFTLLVLYQ